MIPIVEMDGDEMTRILWRMIKDELIQPFVDLNTEYYDLWPAKPGQDGGCQVTRQAAAMAIKRLRVGVKCATITPNVPAAGGVSASSRCGKVPNGTIRCGILDGTVFRAPILISRIKPAVTLLEKAHHHRPPRLRRRI